MLFRSRLCWVACLILISIAQGKSVVGQNKDTNEAIQYRLDFGQAASHRVRVEAEFPCAGRDRIVLMMPVWTPGSYMVREYARQIESVEAHDLKGGKRGITKRDKSHWEVDCSGIDRVMVRYELYGREMGVRTNWIEHEFAFLTGAATFLTREDYLDHPHVLECKPVEGWTHLASSLAPLLQGQVVQGQPGLGQNSGERSWIRRAANYDELVDSPIVLGKIDVQSKEIGGALHHLATVPHEGIWDTKKAMEDVAKIVAVEQQFWGEVPYREYWFLNLLTEAGGGLEHDNSTVLMTSRWAQKQRSKNIDWLGLVSHEFFHTWNVRRLRPKVLKQYDYNQEQYTQELWIAEGLTSYYDDLFVIRAGLCTPKEYLERLSKNIQAVQNAPGRLVQSLVDSSFDSWIKFYRPDENAANSRISYYLKGALVGLLLDSEIRARSGGEKSLDDCMRMLWNRHRESGYTNADFLKIVGDEIGRAHV